MVRVSVDYCRLGNLMNPPHALGRDFEGYARVVSVTGLEAGR